jgi:hypothetical protein
LWFDADAVAAELGFKDGSIARVRWNSINRTKIQGSAGGGVKKTPAKKNTPKKRKGDDSGAGRDDELGDGGTPSKTPKKIARKPKAQRDGAGVKIKE